MSLFDIIKYQAIDITSEDELLKLPEELTDLYWAEINVTSSGLATVPKHISHLAFWASWNRAPYQKRFIRALKKYNP